MKSLKLILFASTAMMTAVCCGSKNDAPSEDSPKVLVLYYSQTSNTKAVAQEIATRLGADIEEIVATNPYDGDFQATIERCIQEREQGITAQIQPLNADISKYDVIFLGYPVWFGTYAPPVATFLDSVDLSGKKIAPFCTFGSGGLESSVKDLREKQPKADVLSGYGVRAARLEAVHKEIDNFLKANGFIEGEYTEPEAFPEQHPVSQEESAIFGSAVNGYPMINAKATAVTLRAIADGTEYLFTATDSPRKSDDKVPPSGEIKVYVIVENGKTPVFTKVIR